MKKMCMSCLVVDEKDSETCPECGSQDWQLVEATETQLDLPVEAAKKSRKK